jgi:4a-hydroxytetrahydrobiopterin dehydratase
MVKAIDLKTAGCTVFEGDESPLTHEEAESLCEQLHPDWAISVDNRSLSRNFRFRDFYETMKFVDQVAELVHKEDHHPYFEVSYNRCMIRYTTHSLNGLSVNDFICASHVDTLWEPST